jgi:multicomponent Na+:H+ antiporter subunit E
MKIKTRSRIIVFIFAYFTWLALTGFKSSQELITGAVFAVLVSLAAGHFLITTEKSGRNIFKRTAYFLLYIIKFIWEMIKANLHVAFLVIHPYKPINPGIVKINTSLTKDSSLTILCNSITLTPGTLTIDLNKSKGEIYIHWIDVKPGTIKDNTREIGFRFEKILKEVFE